MNSLSGAPSFSHEILDLLKEHFELGQLEWRYESEAGQRRLQIMAFAGLCLLSAFVYLQIILTLSLLHWGLPLFGTCFGLALFWAILGALVYVKYGRRDVRVPEPFAGSIQESRRTIEWMQKNFS